MGILNPCHGSNYANAQLLPDASPARASIFKGYANWDLTFTADEASRGIVLYTLPFFEAPFAFSKWCPETARQELFVLRMPATMKEGEGYGNALFLHDHGVYAKRMIGKGMTIENTTPIMTLSGKTTVGRSQSNIDSDTIYLNYDATNVPAIINQRILQRVPNSAEEVSSLVGTTDSWKAQDGAYLVSHHLDYLWQKRDNMYNSISSKLVPNEHDPLLGTDADPNDRKYCLSYTDKTTGHLYYAHPYTGLGTVNDLLYGVRVGEDDHSDITTAVFSGLTVAPGSKFSISIKGCMAYEFLLKSSSDLQQYTEIRTPDINFFNLIMAFESMQQLGGYPANYNFWDKIWNGFKKFWNLAGGNVAQRLGDAALPGLGTGLAAVGDVLTKNL